MKRVVITGMGIVCPTGTGIDYAWKNVLAGKSGIKKITGMDVEDIPSQIAGMLQRGTEPGEFNPDAVIDPREQRRLDILIKINNRLLIIIENKIFSNDHDQQLKSYSDWLETQPAEEKYLVYLTLYGTLSIEGFSEDKYKCLSYKKDIIQWLKDCSSLTQFDMRYHLALFQYQEFWEKWFMETNELNEKIIQLIISNSTSYNSAKQIAADFGKARIHLISSTLQKWQKTKQQYLSKMRRFLNFANW